MRYDDVYIGVDIRHRMSPLWMLFSVVFVIKVKHIRVKHLLLEIVQRQRIAQTILTRLARPRTMALLSSLRLL